MGPGARAVLVGLGYVLIGWLLLAAVPGLGHVFQLTLALPATTAILLVHVSYAQEPHEDALPAGLAIAIALGYLEDLHQGAPTGTLSLAHGLAFLLVHWSAGRLSLPGLGSRAAAAGVVAAVVDLLTWAILLVLAEPLGIRRESLAGGLSQIGWRVVVTALACYPVWLLVDQLFDLPERVMKLMGRGAEPPTHGGPPPRPLMRRRQAPPER